MPFRPNPTKKLLIPLAQVSPPPRADPTPQQQPAVEEPVRPVGVSRGNLLDSSVKNPPPIRRKCSGSCLTCATLTMLLK
jgi:hypothetical protein